MLLAGKRSALYCILHERQGFVRQALEAGAALVPCLALGETLAVNPIKVSGALAVTVR